MFFNEGFYEVELFPKDFYITITSSIKSEQIEY
jgi:hypothetical protein